MERAENHALQDQHQTIFPVAKICLVNIVIDGFPRTPGKMGNGKPIIGEAREPSSSVNPSNLS